MHQACRGRKRLLVATSLVMGMAVSSSFAVDREWPQFAHDKFLSCRTELTGDIVAPRESWTLSLAGTQLTLAVRPADGDHITRLLRDPDPSQAVPGRTTGPRLLDIDGTGTPRPAAESHASRWARILPGVPGYQRVAWSHTWTSEEICRLQLFAHDHGHDKPRLVWESEPEGTVYMPLCVVDDIDSDGTQEICVATHYRVMIFEGTTGRKESELRFHTSRSYGWFGLADVDADALPELVVLSDFQSHLDVVDYDPALPEVDRLQLKWRRDIEVQIDLREKWPQIGPRPLVDVTGDERPEIVFNLFNDSGDGQWHVVVLDAASGDSLFDLPGRYTHGAAGVGQHDKAALFCTRTAGGFVYRFGECEILSLVQDETRVLWSRPSAGFATASLPQLDPHWATGATEGMRHVLLSTPPANATSPRGPAFVVVSREPAQPPGDHSAPDARPRFSVEAIRLAADRSASSLWKVERLVGHATLADLSEDEQGVSATINLQLPRGIDTELVAHGARPVVTHRSPLGTTPHAPIAAIVDETDNVDVLVQGSAETVYCIRAPADQQASPSVRWQLPGRGIGKGAQPGSLVAADLDRRPGREVIFATDTPSGAAMLVAVHGNGKTVWRSEFTTTRGGIPIHNASGLIYWWPGNFRSRDSIDVFVTTTRGLMHSAVGHLLDGTSGNVVWSQHRAEVAGRFAWGYTGAPVAAADLLGLGRDQIVNLYPVCYWLADGATGQIDPGTARDLAARKVVPAWAAYGEPLVHDLTRDGELDLLLDSPYMVAALDATGKPHWQGRTKVDAASGAATADERDTTTMRHALVDFDGDGNAGLAAAGYHDGVRAIDAASGDVLWSIKAPPPTALRGAAANIDGRPGDEFLYVADSELVVVTGNRESGRVLWTWQASAPLSLPAIADVDRDGKAEIVLQSADGVVHCLDGPPQDPSPDVSE